MERFQIGAEVEITGLKAQPEYNGKLGTIVCFHKAKGRYGVHLLSSSQEVLIKAANLRTCLFQDKKNQAFAASHPWECFCGSRYKTREGLEQHLAHPNNRHSAEHGTFEQHCITKSHYNEPSRQEVLHRTQLAQRSQTEALRYIPAELKTEDSQIIEGCPVCDSKLRGTSVAKLACGHLVHHACMQVWERDPKNLRPGIAMFVGADGVNVACPKCAHSCSMWTVMDLPAEPERYMYRT